MCFVCCNRDAAGRIVKPAPFQTRLTPGTVARVEPNRRWFGEFTYILRLNFSVVCWDFCCLYLLSIIVLVVYFRVTTCLENLET